MFCLHGRDGVCHRLAHGKLEVAVALPFELLLRLFERAAAESAIDREKVADPRLFFGGDDAVVAVGDGAPELADDGILVVRKI